MAAFDCQKKNAGTACQKLRAADGRNLEHGKIVLALNPSASAAAAAADGSKKHVQEADLMASQMALAAGSPAAKRADAQLLEHAAHDGGQQESGWMASQTKVSANLAAVKEADAQLLERSADE